jgi:NADPH2:quinone reductase
MEGAGEIAKIGGDAVVPGLRVGERVWFSKRGREGSYAQYVVCERENVHPLPGRLGFAQGAAIHIAYSTAWRAIFQVAGARPGESVLIHGASGGVGLAAVQCARAGGLRVAGTAGTDAGRRVAASNGAEAVFDHREQGYEAKVAAWSTPLGGLSIIIEMLANVNLQRDLDLIGTRGRIVVVGNRGNIEINPRAAMTKDASIHGMSMFNARPEESREIVAAIGAGLANGTLTPIVAQEIGMEEAARAHIAVIDRAGGGALGKVVLVMR